MMHTGEKLFTFDARDLAAMRMPLRAEPDSVHVWAFALDCPPECIELCRSWLSAAECERADRFVFARDRIRYTVAHGVLRRLLGLYCNSAPEALRFSAAVTGKPALQPVANAPPISFNLTHSHARALVGVSIGRQLGIDLE